MKKTTKYLIIALLILIFIYLITKVFSLAKYTANYAFDYYLKSKGFYFTSDYLDINGKNNVNTAWDGNAFKVNLKNSLNSSVATESDINYKINCEVVGDMKEHATCKFTENNSDKYEGILSSSMGCFNYKDDDIDVSKYSKEECENKGYIYSNKETSKDLYIEIEPNDNVNISDIEVIVTASSSKPYSKTITGKYVLHKQQNYVNDIDVNYDDYDKYGNLFITNNSNSKCLEITWNSDNLRLLEIDDDNIISSVEDTNNYINQIKVLIDAKSNLKYNFYKSDFSKNYDISAFTINDIDC